METTGTIFYGSRTSPETIWMALSAMAEGLSIRSTARVFGVDKDAVQHWLNQASEHMETVSRYLFHNLDLTQVQVDELWALMGRCDSFPRNRQLPGDEGQSQPQRQG